MSDIPELDGEAGGVDAESAAAIIAGAAAAGAAARISERERCLSCEAVLTGPFCATCGQKDDDMRRSSTMLARDFIADNFSFDSRMWRTLGLMARAPGRVPSDFSHGRRSRYTPPVRLFLVVSFLFFFLLSVTQTMFAAVVVEELPLREATAGGETRVSASTSSSPATLTVNGSDLGADENLNCNMSFQLRFFVRSARLNNDIDQWRQCMSDASEKARGAIDETEGEMTPEEARQALDAVDRGFKGVTAAIENPEGFNTAFNLWLPRVILIMTPVLAIILSLFIRGKGALFFDHLVLSFYSHAVAFVVVGAGVILAQAGLTFAAPLVALVLIVYTIVALKRAYGRGWIKTLWTSFAASFLYLVILLSSVLGIVGRIVWTSA